jgi:4-amino-4-deoxy-L-arabinose transferase-like glycosyltransferase
MYPTIAQRIRNCLREERVIVFLCIAVFLVSVGYAFAYRIQPAVDARAYDTIAQHIAEGRGFVMTLGAPLLQDDAMTYQGPLYEFVLAGVYAVFGHHISLIWILQAVLRALSALFIYLICVEIFGKEERRIGWFAAALFGFYPDLVEIGAMLMTETLFLFFSALSTYCFIRLFKKRSTAGIIALSLSFGAAVLTRSTVVACAPFILFWFWTQRAWKHTALFLVLLAAILIPWTVRNYRIYHAFIPTMANFGYNLYTGNQLTGTGEGGAPPELSAIFDRLGMIKTNAYGVTYFKAFVTQHPFVYAKLTGLRVIKYFSVIRPMGFWFYQTGIKQAAFVASSALWSFILFGLAFAGAFIAFFKEKHRALNYLAGFALVTCLPVIAILVETRYRFPIYPFLAVFGGFALSRWLKDRSGYKRYVLSGFALVSAIGAIDLLFELPKVLDRIHTLLG